MDRRRGFFKSERRCRRRYTHFLLKGLAKVRCEWSLTTLAYNLKRVLNLVTFEKLMAAVTELLRLRVQDVDIEREQLIVRAVA